MKIEKISDNQIRCILTGEDLAERQLKLSELAYGTDKARRLFQDMMQQASFELGFEAENIPLMIEAVPLSSDSIALIVTKVENPDELDSRFASFAPSVEKDAAGTASEPSAFEQLMESLRDLLPPQKSASADDATARSSSEDSSNAPSQTQSAQQRSLARLREYAMTHRLYVFESMSGLISAAHRIDRSFTGHSALYQDPEEHLYYLFLGTKDQQETLTMQSVFAILSEYGHAQHFAYAREQSLLEHCRILIENDALERLAGI